MLGNDALLCHFCQNANLMATYSLKLFTIQPRCLQCGGEILQGRKDRKFCCEECKNRWHNKRRYPARAQLEGTILRILDRNRSILDRLLKMGIDSIDLFTLSRLGFDNTYVTSYRKIGRRNIYGCFDLQYEMTPSRIRRLMSLASDGEGALKLGKRGARQPSSGPSGDP